MCCDVCRTLYYIDVLENAEGSPVIVVEPANLEPEDEFDIIRNAQKRTPLKEYLAEPEDQNINPHFQQQDLRISEERDLKSAIEESVTPSDLIRRIKAND